MEIARLAGCGTGVIRDMAARGLVEERLVAAAASGPSPLDWRKSGIELTPDQSAAASFRRRAERSVNITRKRAN